MKLRVHAFLIYATGEKEFDMKAPATIRQLLEDFSNRFGEPFDKWIWSSNEVPRRLMPGTIIMVNGKHIAHLNGLDTPLCEEDVVNIFPPVGGG